MAGGWPPIQGIPRYSVITLLNRDGPQGRESRKAAMGEREDGTSSEGVFFQNINKILLLLLVLRLWITVDNVDNQDGREIEMPAL